MLGDETRRRLYFGKTTGRKTIRFRNTRKTIQQMVGKNKSLQKKREQINTISEYGNSTDVARRRANVIKKLNKINYGKSADNLDRG